MKYVRWIAVALALLLILIFVFMRAADAKPVSKDGCSGGLSKVYRLLTGKGPRYEYCCRRHDDGYARDGTATDRLKKDNDFAVCIAKTDPPAAGPIWLAVRIFGQPFQHFDWKQYRRDYATRWQYERDRPL
jgi:hypothetical protein